MLQSVLPPSRLFCRRRLALAVMAAWGVSACAQTGTSVAPPPLIAQSTTQQVTSAVAAGIAPAAVPTAAPTDPLADLIQSANAADTAEAPAAAPAVENPDFVDRKSTRLNSSHTDISRMPSSA